MIGDDHTPHNGTGCNTTKHPTMITSVSLEASIEEDEAIDNFIKPFLDADDDGESKSSGICSFFFFLVEFACVWMMT